MKKLVLAAPILALALGGTTACATKKMVRTQVGEVNGKVETLSKSVEEKQERTRANEATDRRSRPEGGCRRAARRCGRHVAPMRRMRRRTAVNTRADAIEKRVEAPRLRGDPQRRQGRIQVRQDGDARRGEGDIDRSCRS